MVSEKNRNIPCSAVGSSEALGSSKRKSPIDDSVLEASDRMNVRALTYNQYSGMVLVARNIHS